MQKRHRLLLLCCVLPFLTLSVIAQSSPATHPSATTPQKAIPHKSNQPRPELVACKSRIKELSATTAHLEALTPETLIAAQKEVTDCVFTESGLSRDDLIGAYSIRDDTGREAMRRIKVAAEQQEKEFNTLRDNARTVAEAFLDGDKRYRALVSDYNNLVTNYNGLLVQYRSNLNDDVRFLQQLQHGLQSSQANCDVQGLTKVLNSRSPAPPIQYQAQRQIRCTTQNIPAAVPGANSFSYTNCQ
jgi:hypothetical protein